MGVVENINAAIDRVRVRASLVAYSVWLASLSPVFILLRPALHEDHRNDEWQSFWRLLVHSVFTYYLFWSPHVYYWHFHAKRATHDTSTWLYHSSITDTSLAKVSQGFAAIADCTMGWFLTLATGAFLTLMFVDHDYLSNNVIVGASGINHPCIFTDSPGAPRTVGFIGSFLTSLLGLRPFFSSYFQDQHDKISLQSTSGKITSKTAAVAQKEIQLQKVCVLLHAVGLGVCIWFTSFFSTADSVTAGGKMLISLHLAFFLVGHCIQILNVLGCSTYLLLKNRFSVFQTLFVTVFYASAMCVVDLIVFVLVQNQLDKDPLYTIGYWDKNVALWFYRWAFIVHWFMVALVPHFVFKPLFVPNQGTQEEALTDEEKTGLVLPGAS